MRTWILISALLLAACGASEPQPPKDITNKKMTETFVDLSKRDKPAPVVDTPWQDVIIGIPQGSNVPSFFKTIGGFETLYTDADTLKLGAPNTDGGYIRFETAADDAAMTRPYGSHSWDTGCYFSLMMRAKNLPSIISDAKALGWEPLTEMAYLEFGPSKLNIVVLGHKKTGIQVQLYERLTTTIPEGFPEFKRISRPFNIMQMVRDRDAAYNFYQQGLGFETFFYGKPYRSPEPEIMPLGIPKNLTTQIAYNTGIVTPKTGLEWGRMEMIEVQMDGGEDMAANCKSGNIGITEVRFEVDSVATVYKNLRARKVDFSSPNNKQLTVKAPDGANITFYQK